jgi:N-methylhydantoinase B
MSDKQESGALDPVTFAVIKARVDGIIQQMAEVVLRTSRNPILNLAKDFTCSVLTSDGKLLTMVNSLPIHLLALDSNLRQVISCYQGDISPGDCFVNNDPYYGNSHVGDVSMFAPVFFEGKLICWVATLCHLIDIGASIPSSLVPLAKDLYEEGLHIPPLRIAQGYREIPGIVRLIQANFRYPEQWHGDFLAQVGSLWKGEQELIKLCERYGGSTVLQFQKEYLDYGDVRMAQEVSGLPAGEWSIEALSERMEDLCPDGLRLKMTVRIEPKEGIIEFDLREMPDQLAWGFNLSEACSRGACIQGLLPSLDPTLPRNDGVFRHITVRLREGAVVGVPKWPASTSSATMGITDYVSNMVLNLWEEIVPGKGHAGHGFEGATVSITSGTDFRRNHAPYGSMNLFAASGSGASRGFDGWPNFLAANVGGSVIQSSVELTELVTPQLVWELGIVTDSCGAGKWRGAPGTYHRLQPRQHTLTIVACGVGHSEGPFGVCGGQRGALQDHWREKHATKTKIERFRNAGICHVNSDEDWLCYANGGGGYGEPLQRDPELVAEDVANSIVSMKAAREIYGVVVVRNGVRVLLDRKATEKLRNRLGKSRRER